MAVIEDLLHARLPLQRLIRVRLHQPHDQRLRPLRHRLRQPPGPEAPARRDQRRREAERAPGAEPGQESGHQRQEPEAVRPDERHRLDHRGLDPGVAEEPPGEPGQDVPARVVGERPERGQEQDAARPRRPPGPRQRERHRPEQRQPAGHADEREGRHPAVDLGLDQERLDDPEQRWRRTAPRRPPSRGRRRPTARACRRGTRAAPEAPRTAPPARRPAAARARWRRRRRRRARAVPWRPSATTRRSSAITPRGRPIPPPPPGPPASSRTRSRLIRRASASTTSNSWPSGWRTTSPRTGTRPARRKTRPPRVSTSSACSGSTSRTPATALELLEVHARLREEDAGRLGGPERPLVLVVLVLDVADDLLEQVLDGDEAVDAAIFVDHHRHVDARGLHLLQQHADRHRRRRIEQRPEQPGEVERGRPGAEAVLQREILEVDEADRLVERLRIDRQPRQRARLEDLNDLLEGGVIGDRDDVGARDADVLDAQPAHVAKVDQEIARAGDRVAVLRGRLAQRVVVLGVVPAEQAGEEGRLGGTVRISVVGQARPCRRLPV